MKPARALAAATLAIAGSAQAQEAADWQVSGSNGAHAEYYRVNGDPSGGPYQDVRGQYYDDIALSFVRRLSSYDVIRGQFSGVANDSIYRASERGFTTERVNLVREKGDGAIPYRAEGGDLFASFSYRTLQTSLKGAMIDLQPLPYDDGSRQSIVLVTGSSQPSWRHLHGHDNWTTGISWLYEAGPQARVSANAVHVFHRADEASGTPMRQQVVASVAGDYAWQWSAQKLHFEGEIAGLHGDHEGFADATGAVDPASGRDRRGGGVFAQLSGSDLPGPLDYRFRYERYDRDFRPAEAAITADHRGEEAHAGWRLADGRVLRARVQEFVDGLQTGNELKTHTVGARLEGPIFAPFTGSVEAYWQEQTKRDSSVDRATWNLSAYLSGPLSATWSSTMNLQLQDMHDRVPGAQGTRSAQLDLGVSRAWTLQGWSGSFGPGVTLRRSTGGGSAAVTELFPSLSVSLARNGHELSASYGFQRLRTDATTVDTVDVNRLQLTYRYVRAQDTIGVELQAYDRHVTVDQYNDTYRAAVYWTHTFGSAPTIAGRIVPAALYDPAAALPRGLSLLVALAPGMDMDIVRARLDGAGYRGTMQGGTLVYEMRVIDDLDNRQRLVIEGSAGRVARIGVIVDLRDPNDAAAASQTYERARKALLDRFGNPSISYDQGALGPTLGADLNAARVVRAMEWRTTAGMLRLGIPRRVDGAVRIEIQHAPALASPRDGRWSFEEVR